MADITVLIRADHDWFREQFARLDSLRAQAPVNNSALERVWRPLADKLDVHAYIEEKIFYPQLLKRGTDDPEGETLDDLLVEAFALCREAGRRTLAMRHFDVQLIGGMVLHEGKIAEMKTGEGKTLVATLPVYLNSLAGKGVHVVTVNDYLANRDAACSACTITPSWTRWTPS